MQQRSYEEALVTGTVRIRSHLMSNRWRLINDRVGEVDLQRHGRIHVSTVTLPDRTRWILEPHGWGVVRAMGANGEFARITRRSWIGRHWELTSPRFAYELVSRPVPRRWYIGVGGSPVTEIAGSLVSYNRVNVTCSLSMPLVAVALAWHVIARPWEAAAAPSTLIAVAPPKVNDGPPKLIR